MRGLAFAVAAAIALAGCNSQETQVERAMGEIEQAEPIFGLLRTHEPAAYAEMRALIERTVAEGGRPDQRQLIQRGREIFGRSVQRKLMVAPDEKVREMMLFVVDQTGHLQSNPAVCRDLLAGTAGDVRTVIPPEMQQRERRLYEDLLRAPGNAQQRVASAEEAGAKLGTIMQEGEQALGMSGAALATALEGRGPPEQVCRANNFLMRRLSELPPNEGAPMFRLLLQMGAEATAAPRST